MTVLTFTKSNLCITKRNAKKMQLYLEGKRLVEDFIEKTVFLSEAIDSVIRQTTLAELTTDSIGFEFFY